MTRRLAFLFLLGAAPGLFAQARTTASRQADAQVGVAYTLAHPGYVQQTFQGFAAYADLDLTLHLGAEAEFHQANSTNGDRSYQRTYELGARYFRTYGSFVPYAKALIGRGDYIYPTGQTGVAYNFFAAGAGADLKLSGHIHVRGDYEFQRWSTFQNGSVNPQLVSIGVAYHFAGKPRYR